MLKKTTKGTKKNVNRNCCLCTTRNIDIKNHWRLFISCWLPFHFFFRVVVASTGNDNETSHTPKTEKKSNHVQKWRINLTVGNLFDFPFADSYRSLIIFYWCLGYFFCHCFECTEHFHFLWFDLTFSFDFDSTFLSIDVSINFCWFHIVFSPFIFC